MDPIAIVGVVDASLDLALKCASAVKRMNDIASKYKYSKYTIMSITQNLDTIQIAWDRIGAWTQSYTPDENADDDCFVLRMARILETGVLVIDALEEELVPFSDENPGFTQRAKLIWNENTFLDHQSRIRDQAISMNLLLQAIQLPTPKDRGKLIRKSEKQFKKSDESAYSIVPSRMSISTRQTDGQESIRSEEDMIYRRLSFEDDLFTARVYKRNYRNPMLLRPIKTKPQKTSAISQNEGHSMFKRFMNDRRVIPSTETSAPNKVASFNHGKMAPDVFASYLKRERVIESQLSKSPDGSDTTFDEAREDETLDPRLALPSRARSRQRIISASKESSRIFMNACEQGDYNTVQTFLNMGHDVHSQRAYPDSPGFGAIHAATMYGHTEIVQILLQHGASIEDRTTSIGARPLHLAAQSGNAPMVQLLLRYGAQIGAENQLGEQPIHLAAKFGLIEALRALIDGGATLHCSDHGRHQPLHCAAEYSNRPDMIEFLVHAGADINAWKMNERPLHIACRLNLVGNVRALLALGAKTTSGFPSGSSPLYTAIEHGSMDALEALLEHGVDTDWPGFIRTTALHSSLDIRASNVLAAKRSLQLLLRYKADVNAQDDEGDTALHKVARQAWKQLSGRQIQLASILLDNNADRDALNKSGNTPLYYTTKGRQYALSMLLIKSGARLLIVKDEYTFRLHVNHSTSHGSRCVSRCELHWSTKPGDHHSSVERNFLEDTLVQALCDTLADFKVLGIPLAIGKHDVEFEPHVSYLSHQVSDRVRAITRMIGLWDKLDRLPISPASSVIRNDSQLHQVPDPAQHATPETDEVGKSGTEPTKPIHTRTSTDSIRSNASTVLTRTSKIISNAYTPGLKQSFSLPSNHHDSAYSNHVVNKCSNTDGRLPEDSPLSLLKVYFERGAQSVP